MSRGRQIFWLTLKAGFARARSRRSWPTSSSEARFPRIGDSGRTCRAASECSKYDVTRSTGLQASKTDFGYNVGVGASVLFSRHVGAELDVRYFRNTRDFTLGGLDFPENILEYARWSGGLVLRF